MAKFTSTYDQKKKKLKPPPLICTKHLPPSRVSTPRDLPWCGHISLVPGCYPLHIPADHNRASAGTAVGASVCPGGAGPELELVSRAGFLWALHPVSTLRAVLWGWSTPVHSDSGAISDNFSFFLLQFFSFSVVLMSFPWLCGSSGRSHSCTIKQFRYWKIIFPT